MHRTARPLINRFRPDAQHLDDIPMTDKTTASSQTATYNSAAGKPLHKSPEELIDEFRQRFPAAFPSTELPPPALALGIHRALAKAGYNYVAVQKALFYYTNKPAYLATLSAGKSRINLEGEVVGEVTEVEQAKAASQLESLAGGEALAISGRLKKVLAQPQRTMQALNLGALQAKVTFIITPASFHNVLELDSTGLKGLPVEIDDAGKPYHASLNPKSFRRAQSAFKAAINPAVSVSGNLKGYAIESAGVQVFNKGESKPSDDAAHKPA
jgi:hypothetical protein